MWERPQCPDCNEYDRVAALRPLPHCRLFLHDDGCAVVRCLVEMLCHLCRHANAAVRGALTRNEARMHSIATREAQKVRHFGTVENGAGRFWIFPHADVLYHGRAIFIDIVAVLAGNMICVLLNDAIFPGRRFVTLSSRRDVRFPDQMFAFVEVGSLFVQMNDDFGRTVEMIIAPISAHGMRCSERGPERVR